MPGLSPPHHIRSQISVVGSRPGSVIYYPLSHNNQLLTHIIQYKGSYISIVDTLTEYLLI